MNKTGIVKDDRYLDHIMDPGHPESPERLRVIYKMLVDPEMKSILENVKPRPATREELAMILPKPFEFLQLKRALLNTIDMLNPDQIDLKDLHPEDMKVLVVDDSSTARKHIKRVLGSMGIEKITEADDGASAVPILNQEFFDFVVTDYNMPKMDGKALLEHIRNKSNQRSIPVLMVTSEGDMSKLAAVEQSGVSGHLRQAV